MSMHDAPKRDRTLATSLITLFVVLVALVGAFLLGKARANRGLPSPFEVGSRKIRLIAAAEVDLLASADAEKGAVMAETDEQSRAFAEESMRAAAMVERDLTELGRMIEADAAADELAAFRELGACWTKYQDVNSEVLALAVENANLKARRLSLYAARDALVRMRVALDELVGKSQASVEGAAIAAAAYRALTAALEIHVLESRHIAEADDAEMDRIETEMRAFDERVTEGLRSLTPREVSKGAAVAAVDARAAYEDFRKVNAEVLVLSRHNTNVRSLAISLGRKREVTTQCQERLHVLHEIVRTDDPKATR